MSDLMTLAEACERLGWGVGRNPQQRLLMRLRRAEKRTGTTLMVGQRGCVRRVSWRRLLNSLKLRSAASRGRGPEWLESMRTLEDKIAGLADQRIDRKAIPRIARLERDAENAAKAIIDLQDCIRRLVK